MIHKIMHYAFVVLALVVLGALVRYSVFENYAATSRNKATLNAASLLEIPTTNAANTINTNGTTVNKSEESFEATLSTEIDAPFSALFKINPDQKSIVYYIHEELGTSSARLYCVTGPKSGFTVLTLNAAGTLTHTDIVPIYSQNCAPEIRGFSDLLTAIRSGTIYFILGDMRAKLIPHIEID